MISIAKSFRAALLVLWVTSTSFIACLINVLLIPYTLLFDPDHVVMQRVAQAYSRLSIKLFFNVEIHGMENMPHGRTFVAVSNHQSMLDAFIVNCIIMDVKAMAKKSLLYVPGIGALLWSGKNIFVSRTDPHSKKDAMNQCRNFIRRNHSVLIFSEGTRKVEGKLGPFRYGAFALAHDEHTPILPLTISGARHIMPPTGCPQLGWGVPKLYIHPLIEPDNHSVDDLMNQTRDSIASALDDELDG